MMIKALWKWLKVTVVYQKYMNKLRGNGSEGNLVFCLCSINTNISINVFCFVWHIKIIAIKIVNTTRYI